MMKRSFGLILILLSLAAGLTIAFAESGDRPRGTDDRPRLGGPPHDGPPREPGPPVNLTPEQIDEAVEVMSQISPWWGERLAEARAEDEARFVSMVTRMYPRVRQFLELKRHDPALYQLRINEAQLDSRSRRLSWQVFRAQRDSDTAKADQFKTELLSVLAQQFDVSQQARRHEVESLKTRIRELESELAGHDQDRGPLIEQRYQELMDQAERFDQRRRQHGDDDRAGPRDHPPDGDAPPPGDHPRPPHRGLGESPDAFAPLP